MNVKVGEYRYTIGLPACGKMQMWAVFHDPQVGYKFENLMNLAQLRFFFRITIIFSCSPTENSATISRTIAFRIKM